MRNDLNKIFIGIIALVMIFGLARTFTAPEDIIEDENRYGSKIEKLTLESYLNGSFQDSVEAALSDQIFGASVAKSTYNKLWSSYSMAAIKFVSDINPDKTSSDITYGDVDVTDDTVAVKEKDTETKTDEQTPSVDSPDKSNETSTAPDDKTDTSQQQGTEEKDPGVYVKVISDGEKYYGLSNGMYSYKGYVINGVGGSNQYAKFDSRLKNIAELSEAFPYVDFYVSYSEKSFDVSFTTGYRPNFFEYMVEHSNLPESHFARLKVLDFNDYAKWYYKSDHHQCYEGSYQTYKDTIAMLKPYDKYMEPKELVKVGTIHGSLTKTDETANYYDDALVYDFDYPEFTITSNGKPASYGNEAKVIADARNGKNNISTSYGYIYGYDTGELHFHNPDAAGAGSLLVFGNSYDNGHLRLLACHYENLYSVDLRNYQTLTGKAFKLSDYLSEHEDISEILFTGSYEFFTQGAFNVQK